MAIIDGTAGDDIIIGTGLADTLSGNTGNDQLTGLAGDDTLVGGSGNDTLDGGSGNDTYVFSAGDGFDVIWEGSGMGGFETGGVDTIQLQGAYDPATVQLMRWGNDLVISAPSGDQIVVREHFGSDVGGNPSGAIEQITFADGTVWDTEAINNRLAGSNNNMPTESGDTIGGNPWNDYLFGLGGNDTISGGQGDDWIDGNSGNDRLFGNQGNDTLSGGDGNDTLAGNAGSDTLNGGAGNDTYLFNLGDGTDRIDDLPTVPGEANRVVFGDGIRFADLRAYLDYSIGGVTIEVGQSGDRLQLAGSAPDPYGPHTVSTFQFDDGTLATYDAVAGYGVYWQGTGYGEYQYGSQYGDSLYGNAGDDQVFGGSGNDILAGGQGNDYLDGGQGDDTYLFNRGDGADYVSDVAQSPDEGNRVAFGEGIAVEDVLLRTDGWRAWIEIAAVTGGVPTVGTDSLEFRYFYPFDAQAPRSVATFEFADGTTLTTDELIARGFYLGGTAYQDFLYGTGAADRIYGYGDNDQLQGAEGNDTLIGGTGNDVLSGGAGADTYVFSRGDGVDIIDEMAFPGEANRVVFGDGISLDDVHLITPNGDLRIEIGSSADALIFAGYSPLDTTGPQPVQSFVFADGSSISYADLIARGYYIGGTEGNDSLYGDTYPNAQNNVMYGYGGDDSLSGYAGNDTLVGGTGNDLLYGGSGSDTYLFNRGDGADSIFDLSVPGETNRVVFGRGINPSDVTLRLDGTRLLVQIGWNGDQLILDGFDRSSPDGAKPIDTFAFADGSTLSFADLIAAHYVQIDGTAGDDFINGTYANDLVYANAGNDVVYGFGGDDQLWGDFTGQTGNDILDGGDGNDSLYGTGGTNVLIGGQGDDSYQVESTTTDVVENVGEGIDNVVSSVDYALAANVENLRLAGSVIRGTGNELANDLYGNSANNILDGGAGIDRMYGYQGDDTYIVDNAADLVGEYSGGGNDTVRSSVAYTLAANVENLVLTGTAAIDGTGNVLNNTITGNAGDNTLSGSGGADTLAGGAGADSLLGGLGGDTYVYNLGDGNDTVFELESATGDVDKIVFGSGIAAQDITVMRGGANGDDLQIAFAGSGDTFTIRGWFNPAVSGQVEQFRFADGTVLTGAQVEAMVNYAPAIGQPLADQVVLEDTALSFVIPANTFVDPDNDTLSFTASLADGSLLPTWLQFDAATRTFSGVPGNAEVGNFDIRVTATDPRGESVSDTFALAVQNVNDAPTVNSALQDQSGAEGQAFTYQVPDNAFADADVIHGDTLTFSATLTDGSALPAWLVFDANSRTFSGSPTDGNNGSYQIRVLVTDRVGAVATSDFRLNIADRLIVGTGQADTLYAWPSGGIGVEMRGLGGNDILNGYSGNDRLEGGTGDDALNGGTGDDTYVFSVGDGRDTIVDLDTATGNLDTIRFGAGIQQSDISFAGANGDLIITIGTGGDQLTVKNWFSPLSYWTNGYPETANRIERVEFADGSSIDLTTRTDIVHTITGGANNDTIQGGIEDNIVYANGGSDTVYAAAGSDTVFGGTGNDTLYGESGNDVLSGGVGTDTLYGGDVSAGTGNDTYLFNLGDGADTIFDQDTTAGNFDTIRFGAGIAIDMLNPSRSGDNLVVALAGGDSITIQGWYASSANRVEVFQFADDTVLTAAEIQAWADNLAPIVAQPIATQTALEDAPFSFVLPAGTFSDPNAGDVLRYSASRADGSALPEWLSFDAATGVFSGNPGNADVGNYAVRVAATDGYGAAATTDFVLTVQNTNDAPTVAGSVAGQTAVEDQPFSLTVGAGLFNDPDAVHGDTLTLSATLADGSQLPAWLTFDSATGLLSGTPTNSDVGSLALRVAATDSAGAAVSTTFALTVTNVNDAPVVGAPLADQAATEDAAFSFTVPGDAFADVDAGDALSLSATLADGSALPAWLNFDPATRSFAGTPANGDVGILDVRVTATDTSGLSASDNFVLTVANVNDAPVAAATLAGQSANEDAPFTFTLPADAFSDIDAIHGDTLTYAATRTDGSPLPAWLGFDAATRTFSGTPANADVGGLEVRVTATDSAGASTSSDFSLAVANTNDAPVPAVSLANQSVNEDSGFIYMLPVDAFSDVDAMHGDTLSLTAALADGSPLPAWLSFDAATASFSGTPGNAGVGTVNIRVTATDVAGAVAAQTFTLTVANVNDAPVVASAIPDQSAAEGQAFSYQLAANAFTDVDAGDTLGFSASLSDGSALPAWLSFDVATRSFTGTPGDGTAGSYSVRVTATDGSAVTVSDDFVLSVADAIATVRNGTSGVDTLQGTAFRDVLNGLGSGDTLYGYAGDDLLDGGSGSDTMYGGTGNDTYVVGGTGDVVLENAGEGIDTVQSSISYTLGTNVENLTLTSTGNRNGTGNSLDNVLFGNSAANTLTGNTGNDTLDGGAGTDALRGGTGNDRYIFGRGYGTDTVSENDATAGNSDTVALGVDALNVVFAQSGSNLVMSLHGGTDKLTVGSWYSGSQYQTEIIQTADGQQLLNTQVDQLIQAMAQFSATSGLTWDQAIDQRPQDVQAVLAAYWQPAA